ASAPSWDQEQLLEDVVANMPEDQIRPALDILLDDFSAPAQIFISLLVERWAAKAPADAAQWISKLPNGPTARRMYAQVAEAWTQQDLDAALAWMDQLRHGENRDAARLAIADEAAPQQPLTALNLLADLTPNEDYKTVLDRATQQWAKLDPNAAVTWVKKWPDSTMRGKMLGQIAVNLAVQNPAAAADLLAIQSTDELIPSDDVVRIVRFWACLNPDAASAWVSNFPPGPLQDSAFANLADVSQQNKAEP
ncbi:MAG TPA: hypothetical protein VF988_05560, partial [Verrucomicrobiae bacterium]